MTDPLRPPDTDDEPWAVPAEDRHRSGEWAVTCFLLIALLAFVAWRLSR